MEISLTAISFVVPISTLVNTVTDVWCLNTAVGVGTFEQIGSIARCTVITTTTLSCSKHIAQWDTVQHQLVPLQCAPVNSLMSNWTHKSAYIIWIYLASFLAVSLMPHTHSTSIRSALEVLFRNALTEFGVILTSFCLIRLKLRRCHILTIDYRLIVSKCSAVAETSDRLATIYMGRIERAAVPGPFWGNYR